MKNLQPLLLTLFIAFLSVTLSAQVSYNGAIDKYPVEMLIEIYSDGPANATYCYTNFDTPIPLSGNFKNGTLMLYEKDVCCGGQYTKTYYKIVKNKMVETKH